MSCSGVDDEVRGLVDDEEVGVLSDNHHRDVGFGKHRLFGSWRNDGLNPVTFTEQVAPRTVGTVVHNHLASGDERSGFATRHSRQHRQCTV